MKTVSEKGEKYFLGAKKMFEQREQRNLSAIKSQKPGCRSRSNVRTRHGTMDWFKIGKGVHRGCILSTCLFNLYAEYIMRNVGLDEAQAGIKIAGRDINNLRHADDTTFM